MFAFIKNLFSKASAYFNKIVAKAKPFLEKEIPAAIAVVNMLKEVVNSPVATAITALTPNTADDLILAQAKTLLPKILLALRIARNTTNDHTPEQIISDAIAELQSYDPNMLRGKWKNIEDELTAALLDGKLDWNEIVIVAQMAFDNKQ